MVMMGQDRGLRHRSGARPFDPAGLLFECACRLKPLRHLLALKTTGAIIATPPLVEAGEQEFALKSYCGEFPLSSGTILTATASPFQLANLKRDQIVELSGFSWLRHFQAADNQISRAHARKLIADWIDARRQIHKAAWHPLTVAKRLRSWLTAAPFFLNNASVDFTSKIMRSINFQIRFLSLTARRLPHPADRLEALISLTLATLCVDGHDRTLINAIAWMERELNRQILPDGGHISRSPAVLLHLLQGLTALRETFALRAKPAPPSLMSAIDRMLPMLKFFQLGDRGLCYFGGAGNPLAAQTISILRDNPHSGRPLGHASHSGFHRLERNQSIIVINSGPATSAPNGQNPDCLSFELSHKHHRIIVNCGTADHTFAHKNIAGFDHPTHSALVVEKSAPDFAPRKSALRRWFTPSSVDPMTSSSCSEHAGNLLVEAEHNGFLARYGLNHKRRLYLASDGLELRGEDIISLANAKMFSHAQRGHTFALRFHIHPDVKVSTAQKPNSALLLLPDRTGWTFTAAGATLELQDSVYTTGQNREKRAHQIVLTGHVKKLSKIKWALRQIAKTKKRPLANSPVLPDRSLID